MTTFIELWRKRSTSLPVLGGAVLMGVAIGLSHQKLSAGLSILPEIYVSLMMMLALPLMVSSIVNSLSELIRDKTGLGLFGKILGFFLGSKVLIALLAAMVAYVIGPGRDLALETFSAMGELLQTDLNAAQILEINRYGLVEEQIGMSLRDMVMDIIPDNIFSSLVRNEYLRVLSASILFGLVLGNMPLQHSAPICSLLRGVFLACLKLTIWFTYALPLVLIGTVASLVATSGLVVLQGMAWYLLTIAVTFTLTILIMLAVIRHFARSTWRDTIRSQRESFLLAFVSRSSAACIALTIQGLTKHLGMQQTRVELFVPVGVSFMALFDVARYTIIPIFLAQLFGRELLFLDWGVIIVAGALLSFAAQGASVAALPLAGVTCSYLGLPFASIIVLFLLIDPIEDAFGTVVNVASASGLAAYGAGLDHPAAETE